MTKQRHISVSFSIGILLLLTSSSPLSTVAEGDDGGGRSEWKDDGRVSLEENTPVTWKYNFQWSKSAHKSSGKSVIPLIVSDSSQAWCFCCTFTFYSKVPHRKAPHLRMLAVSYPIYERGKFAQITSLNSLGSTLVLKKMRAKNASNDTFLRWHHSTKFCDGVIEGKTVTGGLNSEWRTKKQNSRIGIEHQRYVIFFFITVVNWKSNSSP